MHKHKPATEDIFEAKLALYLSLGFWIPLFNIGLCFVSLILAHKHLKQSTSRKGYKYTIPAIILSALTVVSSVLFMGIYLFRRITCEVASTLI